jgi:predicted oxidoreductase
MKILPIGAEHTPVSNLLLGNMRIANLSDEAIRALVSTARDAGITGFDHADIYGGAPHRSEARFAEALGLTPSERAELFIQTKCGIVPSGPYFDFSYDHIVSSVDASLRALNTDYIDLLLLHRPDALVEPTEVARAFDHLESTGKVKGFGVSNHTAGQIELLKSAVNQPITVNQLQLSVAHASIIAQGIAANMPDSPQSTVVDGGGLFDYCRLNNITVQAWSPFQGGGEVIFGSPKYPALNVVLRELAATYGVPEIAIATAWITRHPANIQVVVGSTTPGRVADAALGSELPLTRGEWYALLKAAGHIIP